MTWDQEEKQAMSLGALMRSEPTEQDEAWLRESQAELLAALDPSSKSRASTFPLFRDAEAQGKRRSLSSRSLWAAAAIAAGALLAFGYSFHEGEPSLTFTVQGEVGSASEPQDVGRVRSPATESRTLQFSDGSTLKLAQGGSVRVRETDEHGAEVVIEKGTLDSSVKHLDEASWSVFAGPYEIEVIGTRFSTEWDPDTQRLVVLLDEGSVRVVGSDIEDHVALKPGQRFEAAPQQAWKVTAQTPPAPQVVPPEPEPEVESEVSPPTEPQGAEQAPKQAARPADWNALLRNGKNGEILADAKKLGLEACYSTCSVSRLRALADAARYKGEVGIARQALTRLRSRSPSESARAGYLLGSLSEARGQAAGALNWYNTYLREAPSGPFGAEARAGKMRALHALGRHADAVRAANEYLRLYPSGTSATTARRILNKK